MQPPFTGLITKAFVELDLGTMPGEEEVRGVFVKHKAMMNRVKWAFLLLLVYDTEPLDSNAMVNCCKIRCTPSLRTPCYITGRCCRDQLPLEASTGAGEHIELKTLSSPSRTMCKASAYSMSGQPPM